MGPDAMTLGFFECWGFFFWILRFLSFFLVKTSSLLRTDQPFIHVHPQPTLTYPPISPLIIQSPLHTHTHTPLILNYFASQNYRDHASGTLGGLLMLRFGYNLLSKHSFKLFLKRHNWIDLPVLKNLHSERSYLLSEKLMATTKIRHALVKLLKFRVKVRHPGRKIKILICII